MNSKGMACSTK